MKKLLLILLIVPTLSFAESYLCIADASGGLIFNKVTKKLEGTKFQTDSKYVIKKVGDKWSVKEFGESFEMAFNGCKEGIYQEKRLSLSCDVIGGRFLFHFEELRFINTYIGGYLGKDIDGKYDTPHMQAGECQKI